MTKHLELPEDIDQNLLPQHIAVIMDGNGRWAKQQKLPRLEGHRAGTKSVRKTVETCARIGIGVLTLYAFSTENWNRPKSEIKGLMRLLNRYIESERKTVLENNISFRMIGKREQLGKDIIRKIEELEEASAKNTGMIFNVALNYSGRAELTDAVKNIMALYEEGHITTGEVDESLISKNLYTAELADPDLLIRTSGELRISNFLLWQIAYTEIWITDVLWPDFRSEHLFEALRDYQSRERRFGGVTSDGGKR